MKGSTRRSLYKLLCSAHAAQINGPNSQAAPKNEFEERTSTKNDQLLVLFRIPS